MAKPISQLTTDEVEKQMSIAGNPRKITRMMEEILALIGTTIDPSNPAEIINIEFALKRIQAEVGTWKKMYGKRTGQQL